MDADAFPDFPDSLDRVEFELAMEEAIRKNPRLSREQRDLMFRNLRERVERGDFDADDSDDGSVLNPVRVRPSGPQGQAGAAAEL